jgi:hypothetical protein
MYGETEKSEKRYLTIMEEKPILHPLRSLLYSRKFLVLMLDTIVSIILHYVGGSDTEFLIASIQPVAMMIIYAISAEDVAEKKNGG